MDYWAEWRNRFSKNRRVAADQRIQFSRSSRCIDPDLYFRFKDALIRDQTRARARTRRIDREREGAHASSALCPPPPPIPPPLAPLSSPTVIYTLTFKHTRLDLSACK